MLLLQVFVGLNKHHYVRLKRLTRHSKGLVSRKIVLITACMFADLAAPGLPLIFMSITSCSSVLVTREYLLQVSTFQYFQDERSWSRRILSWHEASSSHDHITYQFFQDVPVCSSMFELLLLGSSRFLWKRQ